MKTKSILTCLMVYLHLSLGLYIKPMNEKLEQNVSQKKNMPISDSEWRVFKSKLGLTDSKVRLLKSQKDQKATAELLKRFIRENPKYVTLPAGDSASNNFNFLYKDMLKQLQTAQGTLKASLNFELADKRPKNVKRSVSKIAVKMISDIPSEKIDDLLKLFNEEHGLNDEGSNDYTGDYNEIEQPTTVTDTDYLYENLWEDEEVPNLSRASHSGSYFGSFQDLIMQADRQRWQRQMEELKLKNKHFF